MDLTLAGFTLSDLDRRNVILGKNGCGKSHLLKLVEQNVIGHAEAGFARYITPERAG
jgi:ATPase subunit of ABC transporter with duplicated ATPase domains